MVFVSVGKAEWSMSSDCAATFSLSHLHNFLLSPHLVSDWSTLSAHSNEVELVHDIIDSSDDEHYDDEDDSNGLLTL